MGDGSFTGNETGNELIATDALGFRVWLPSLAAPLLWCLGVKRLLSRFISVRGGGAGGERMRTVL